MNIPTDMVQRADEKNGATCLVSMLAPKVMVLKCQE